jgi:hypothetical protein
MQTEYMNTEFRLVKNGEKFLVVGLCLQVYEARAVGRMAKL